VSCIESVTGVLQVLGYKSHALHCAVLIIKKKLKIENIRFGPNVHVRSSNAYFCIINTTVHLYTYYRHGVCYLLRLFYYIYFRSVGILFSLSGGYYNILIATIPRLLRRLMMRAGTRRANGGNSWIIIIIIISYKNGRLLFYTRTYDVDV